MKAYLYCLVKWPLEAPTALVLTVMALCVGAVGLGALSVGGMNMGEQPWWLWVVWLVVSGTLLSFVYFFYSILRGIDPLDLS